jgi:hypothetical protein
LAKKLGLKDRMVYNLLDDLRLSVEKGICYCKEKRSYIFQKKPADCKEIAVTGI